MIAARDDQFGRRRIRQDGLESAYQQIQPLIGSPFAEGKNAVYRIAPPAKVRRFRTTAENAMMANVYDTSAILFAQGTVVGGQEN